VSTHSHAHAYTHAECRKGTTCSGARYIQIIYVIVYVSTHSHAHAYTHTECGNGTTCLGARYIKVLHVTVCVFTHSHAHAYTHRMRKSNDVLRSWRCGKCCTTRRPSWLNSEALRRRCALSFCACVIDIIYVCVNMCEYVSVSEYEGLEEKVRGVFLCVCYWYIREGMRCHSVRMLLIYTFVWICVNMCLYRNMHLEI